MSVVEMQEKLKLAKEAIKLRLEKLKNRKKSKASVKNRKTKNMTQEQIVGKTVVTKIVEKNKSNPKETLLEIVCDSVYNNDEDSDDDRPPDEEDTFEYALLQDYFEGNLILH